MSRPVMFTLFALGMSTLVAGGHYYLYRRLIKDPDWPQPWRRIMAIALIVLAAGMPLSVALSRVLPVAWSRVLTYPFHVWMGIVFFLVWIMLSLDLVRLITRLAQHLRRRGRGSTLEPTPAKACGTPTQANSEGNPGSRPDNTPAPGSEPVAEPSAVNADRRHFLARSMAGTALVAAGGLSALSLYQCFGHLVVRRVEVPLPRLPRTLDGFTIVQLTDLHLGPTRDGAWLAEVIARTNELKPGLVAITGDLVDGTTAQLGPEIAQLKRLASAYGTFFVTGNHEYYSGASEWVAFLSKLGIRVLRNERVTVGHDPASFDLAGVDDYNARRHTPGHAHDVPKALADRHPRREVVLLAHQPRSIYDAARYGVGLVLSGHTHGGQMWPMRHLVYLQQPYVRGLAKHKGTWIYVSSGTGFWGPPMRLLSTAEITQVVLRARRS